MILIVNSVFQSKMKIEFGTFRILWWNKCQGAQQSHCFLYQHEHYWCPKRILHCTLRIKSQERLISPITKTMLPRTTCPNIYHLCGPNTFHFIAHRSIMYTQCILLFLLMPFKTHLELSWNYKWWWMGSMNNTIFSYSGSRYWQSALFRPDTIISANFRLNIGLQGLITLCHNLSLLGYKNLSDLSKLSISIIVSTDGPWLTMAQLTIFQTYSGTKAIHIQ